MLFGECRIVCMYVYTLFIEYMHYALYIVHTLYHNIHYMYRIMPVGEKADNYNIIYNSPDGRKRAEARLPGWYVEYDREFSIKAEKVLLCLYLFYSF